MKNGEIKNLIMDLDGIWSSIIDADDQISILDRDIEAFIKDGKYDRAYECEIEKTKQMRRIEFLRERSGVLERLIMAMMLEE